MQKPISILLIIIMSFFLISCAQKEVVVEQTTTTETEETTPTTQPSEPEEVKEMSQELKNLIAKADTVKSVQYSYSRYGEKEAGIFIDDAYVKDNKIKHVYPMRSIDYGPEIKRYNTVYFDTDKKRAIAYCEDVERCDDTETPVSVEYDDFHIETPFTVINSITYGEIISSAVFDDREVTIIETTKNGNRQEIYLWEFKGLPLKYEVYDENDESLERVEFKSVLVNQVKDSDFDY